MSGRIHTSGEEILKYTEHNHVGDAIKIDAKKAVTQLKMMSKRVELSTQDVLASVSSNFTMAIAGQMPSASCLKRTKST